MLKTDAEKLICPILSANAATNFTRCQTDGCMAWIIYGYTNYDKKSEEDIQLGYCKQFMDKPNE